MAFPVDLEVLDRKEQLDQLDSQDQVVFPVALEDLELLEQLADLGHLVQEVHQDLRVCYDVKVFLLFRSFLYSCATCLFC